MAVGMIGGDALVRRDLEPVIGIGMQTRLVLENRREELERLSDWLEGLGAERGWPSDGLFELKLAVYEAVANVIFYAFNDDEIHCVTIDIVEIRESEVSITIDDDGIPFDPTVVEEQPYADSIFEASVTGRGILLLKQLSDHLSYERRHGHNRLTLTRRLRVS